MVIIENRRKQRQRVFDAIPVHALDFSRKLAFLKNVKQFHSFINFATLSSKASCWVCSLTHTSAIQRLLKPFHWFYIWKLKGTSSNVNCMTHTWSIFHRQKNLKSEMKLLFWTKNGVACFLQRSGSLHIHTQKWQSRWIGRWPGALCQFHTWICWVYK